MLRSVDKSCNLFGAFVIFVSDSQSVQGISPQSPAQERIKVKIPQKRADENSLPIVASKVYNILNLSDHEFSQKDKFQFSTKIILDRLHVLKAEYTNLELYT